MNHFRGAFAACLIDWAINMDQFLHSVAGFTRDVGILSWGNWSFHGAFEQFGRAQKGLEAVHTKCTLATLLRPAFRKPPSPQGCADFRALRFSFREDCLEVPLNEPFHDDLWRSFNKEAS